MNTELIFREIENIENVAKKQAENWGEYFGSVLSNLCVCRHDAGLALTENPLITLC